jgi:L-cysteine S-thiosulfotransferase
MLMAFRTGSSWARLSAVVLGLALGLPSAHSAAAGNATGQQLAHDVYKGNCLACHQIPGDPSAVSLADIGPPLFHIRERFPDRAALRSQLWNPMSRNLQTVMPPFGKHKVLTEDEIDLIVDYIYQY